MKKEYDKFRIITDLQDYCKLKSLRDLDTAVNYLIHLLPDAYKEETDADMPKEVQAWNALQLLRGSSKYADKDWNLHRIEPTCDGGF